jgi:diguanylate cyclase (GGDEF)-like protein/PAS domain S-box-containing protein
MAMVKPYHILYIEDEGLDAELVCAHLSSSDIACKIDWIDNFHALKQAICQNNYDLILSDYHLITNTAEDVISEIRKTDSLLPIVILSGAVGDEKATELIKLGANDFLLKNKLNKLPQTIQTCIDNATKEKELNQQILFHDEMVKQSKIAFYRLDRNGCFTYCNENLKNILQLDHNSIIGTHILNHIDTPFTSQLKNALHGEKLDLEMELKTKSAKQSHWIKFHIKSIDDPKGYFGSFINIDSIKQNEERLSASLLELRLFHEATLTVANAPSVNDALARCIDKICEIIGWPIGHIYIPNDENTELVSTDIWHVNNKIKAESFIQITQNHRFQLGQGLPGRIWQTKSPHWIEDVHKDNNFPRAQACKDINVHGAVGFPITINDVVIAVLEFFSYESEPENTHILKIFSLLCEQVGHVFEKKKIEKELDNMAHYDLVTSLPNRAYLYEILSKCLSRAQRYQHKLAVIFIDLDNFKYVNDTYGHSTGDNLLRMVAKMLSQSVRDMDYVCRHGGDEFVLILDQISSSNEAADMLTRLMTRFKSPISITSQQKFYCSFSVGIALYPEAGQCIENLLKHADIAMYRSKSQGKNRFSFYTDALEEKNKRRLAIETELRQAISKGELSLVFQPQVNMVTGSIVAAETLLRWNSKKLGQVAPDEFIPIAESHGMILEIGHWVMEQSIAELVSMRNQLNQSTFNISVNCSILQIQDKDFLTNIKTLCQKYNIDGSDLIIEVTETRLMQNIEEIKSKLKTVDQLGIKIAIDDFGTGYSSLNYLKQLPISIIKIDKSFIDGLPDDKNDLAIVEAVSQLAKPFAASIIAEGVETYEQMSTLLKFGCYEGQGYYLAKPLTKDKFISYAFSAKARAIIGKNINHSLPNDHYLKSELYNLLKSDDRIFEFIESSALDGIWYWDLTQPENEWMSNRFWRVLGYEPSERKHLASEWKDIINAEDLKLAMLNFNKHCQDPHYRYDQIVRYKHKLGHTVWIRCRGIAIRDKDNKPIRMLGAHTDITDFKKTTKNPNQQHH